MEKRKIKIYTAANAHLDTSWLWTFEKSVDDYIPDTLKKNFAYIEKYPEYKFNFEGSYRYELIKEYYPEEYEKLKKYIAQGRWSPCGSCFENGDVNIPSPEALIRNILYGNGFFEKEFGMKSNDIFLPDCFGFGRALPGVMAHSGLTGFSTGKLFWGSSVPIPFDTGKWRGIDGNGVWAALMPYSYTTVFPKLKKARRILGKIEENKKKGLPDLTFVYHGIGDRGGAPHKASVRNVVNAQRNNENSETEVYSATTKEFFEAVEALPDAEKAKLPVYDGEFLLTAHGAGSYTSRTVTKRWNRRCELLADAAERFSSAAFVSGYSAYPQYGFDSAWKKVIAHHFHDDITGTSFEECYKRSHNDYIQAMNTFSAEYTAACKAIAENIDTSFVQGIPVVVSNPLQSSSARRDAVSVTVDAKPEFFAVFDKNGTEVPSQTKILYDGKREITFIAEVPSCGLAVYDLRESAEECTVSSDLRVTENSIENKNILLRIDKNGDICSIFDKKLGRELLKSPVRHGVYNNTHSFNWPAWEIKYEDVSEKPYMHAGSPEIKIRDCGKALCSLEIRQKAGKSVFTQVVSLSSESDFVTVYNETDWREEASLLKAEFCLNAENENANYDIGMGCTPRGTNTKSLYEVPAQKWADITDKNEDFGVSVFSDSRCGWDKPDGSTLRLTVVHTPFASYRWECSQHVADMGLNRYSYAIKGHSGNPDVTAHADAFCTPMNTFITEKHSGALGKEYSFVKVNNDSVRITAIKKAQDSDKIIIRFAECSGNDLSGIEAEFSEQISECFEVRGDETVIGRYETDGKLRFDIKHNGLRSFAVSFAEKKKADCGAVVPLNFNAVGITADSNRHASTLRGGISIPHEIMPEKLVFEGVAYEFSADEKNCTVCRGEKIKVGEGFKTLHLLLTSLNGDKTVCFGKEKITVPDCSEFLGYWDMMMLGETGYIKPYCQALTLSHTHGRNGNITAKQFYIFHAEIPLDGQTEISLPDDEDIVIFSATATKNGSAFMKGDSHFDELEKRKFDYEFSAYAEKHMRPNLAEKVLDKFFDRTFSVGARTGEFYNKYGLNELYYILRSLTDRITYKKKAEKLIKERKNYEKQI